DVGGRPVSRPPTNKASGRRQTATRRFIGGIFPEIFKLGIPITEPGTDISFAADGKSDCKCSSSHYVGFLCPGIGGWVIFPEILSRVLVNVTGTDISFAADGKADRKVLVVPPKSAFCIQVLVAG